MRALTIALCLLAAAQGHTVAARASSAWRVLSSRVASAFQRHQTELQHGQIHRNLPPVMSGCQAVAAAACSWAGDGTPRGAPDAMSILDGLNERIARHRNRDFLKAAMAAGALAAQADGTVTLSERYRIDDILARLERLKIYDPRKAVQILDGFLTELRDNAEAAERVLLGKLRRIAEDREAAELVVRIALSVSQSDGAFSAPERARFEEICAVLGFSPERFLGERRPGG